jgi:hypothetical protein
MGSVLVTGKIKVLSLIMLDLELLSFNGEVKGIVVPDNSGRNNFAVDGGKTPVSLDGSVSQPNSIWDGGGSYDKPTSDVDLSLTTSANEVTINNTAGNDVTITQASITDAGVMISADKSKLDSIEVNAKDDQNASEVPFMPNGSISANNVQDAIVEVRDEASNSSGTTNLSTTTTTNSVTIASDTGTDATIFPATAAVAGIMSSSDKAKLDSLQANYVGVYANLAALQAAHPTGNDGEWAIIRDDNGGADFAAWDTGTSNWEVTDVDNITGQTNLGYNSTAMNGTVTSDTGSDAVIPSASTTFAGLMSSVDKSKLDSIEVNAKDDQNASEVPFTPDGSISATNVQDAIVEVRDEAAGVTDLSYTASPNDGTVVSSTGNDATIPTATTVNAGLLTPADKTKLDNLSGSANDADVLPNALTIASIQAKYDEDYKEGIMSNFDSSADIDAGNSSNYVFDATDLLYVNTETGASADNMVLESVTTVSPIEPTRMLLQAQIEPVDALTPANDLTFEVSINEGNNWDSVPVVSVLDYHNNYKLYSASEIYVGGQHEEPGYAHSPITGEVQVNTTTFGTQSEPAACSLSNGGYVIVWRDVGTDGDQHGTYAQVYNNAGATVGSEILVNTTTTDRQIPNSDSAAGLSNGDFVIVWASRNQDGSGYGVYGQRFNSSGTKQGSEFLVNTTTTNDQTTPAVCGLTGGGFVVAWQGEGPGDAQGVFMQRYDNTGAAQGSETIINTYTSTTQSSVSLAELGNGGFVAVWASYGQDGSQYGIYGKVFDANGSSTSSEFLVNTYTTNSQSLPTVCRIASGGFAVAWSGEGSGDTAGVFCQLFNDSGVKNGSEKLVNTYTTDDQQTPDIAMLSNSGFVIVWQSANQDGGSYGVYAQRFTSNGDKEGVEFLVNTTTANAQQNAVVTEYGTDSFVVAWTGRAGQDGDGDGVFSRRYGLTSTGSPTINRNIRWRISTHNNKHVKITGINVRWKNADASEFVDELINSVEIAGVKPSAVIMYDGIGDSFSDITKIDDTSSSNYMHDSSKGLITPAGVETATMMTMSDSGDFHGDGGTRMIDRQDGTGTYLNTGLPGAWVKGDYGVGNAETISSYTLQAQWNGRMFADWVLEGSNDDATWTTLDSQSGHTDWVSYGGVGNPGSQKTFNIANPASYRYYRITVSAAQDGGNNAECAEWYLYSNASKTNMTLVSDTLNASESPDVSLVLTRIEKNGTVDINSDVVVYISRDDGTTWTKALMEKIIDYDVSGNDAMYAASVDLSQQPSGTNLRYKIVTNNGVDVNIHNVGMKWVS